jgi:two-component system, OmpR family, response regulator
LIEYAHGSSYPAFDRSIDVQVSRIRNKLERDPKTPSLIRTVRNAGYIFSSDVTRG